MNVLICDSDHGYLSGLAAAGDEAASLGWEIIEAVGGVVAVPRGTAIVAAPGVDVLMIGLRAHSPVLP